MKQLHAGVVGLGVGEQHLQAYLKDKRCDTVTVCDFSEKKRRIIKNKYPEIGIVKRYQELVDNPDIDVISIASYDDFHASQTIMALTNQKHVFVEKPLCQTLPEALQIKRAWEEQDRHYILGCNFVLRAAPLYLWLRTQIQQGTFGKVYAFDGKYLYGRMHKITSGWRADIKDYSVMAGGGIHMIDLLLWLLGQQPVTVSSAGNRICSEGTPFMYNDFSTCMLLYGSGLIARITANFGGVHKHQHVIRVYGTKATFISDDAGARLYTSRDPDVLPEIINLSPLPETKGDLIPEFITEVLMKKDTTVKTQMIFDSMCIGIASDQSAKTNCKERIEYI